VIDGLIYTYIAEGTSLLSTSYKILSNILLSILSPYTDKIIGDHQCEFRCNRSTTDELHLSGTGEKMGVQRDSTSAIPQTSRRPVD
jgi:hypothetical protein